MTSYRLWPATNGGAATAYSGNFISGLVFAVKGGGNWFEGYWWWVASTGQSTAPVKCALWSLASFNNGVVVPGSVVTSGTLTAGQWNYIPLPEPVKLAPSYDSNSSINGSAYIAAIGCNGSFPYTASSFDAGDAYAAGITNGPLVAYSGTTGTHPAPYGLQNGVFTTTGSDPALTIPTGGDTSGDGATNFWVDVQVADAAPAGYSGSYRLWPNKADANNVTTGDAPVNYTIATEVHLSQECTLNAIHFFRPNTATTFATEAAVWDIATRAKVAVIASPTWLKQDGSAYSADPGAGTWVKAVFPGGVTLPAGQYRVSVFNSNGSSDADWSPKDSTTDYFGETYLGAGSAGIDWGIISAPNWANAAPGLDYFNTANTVPHAQPPFGMPDGGGGTTFPEQFAVVGASNNQTQVYWVDLEVTPIGGASMATKVIGTINLRHKNASAAQGTLTSVTSADVGVLPADGRMVVCITGGATAGTVTLAPAPGSGFPPVTFAFGINGIGYMAVSDPAEYVQSDGLLHFTADQTFTVNAILH